MLKRFKVSRPKKSKKYNSNKVFKQFVYSLVISHKHSRPTQLDAFTQAACSVSKMRHRGSFLVTYSPPAGGSSVSGPLLTSAGSLLISVVELSSAAAGTLLKNEEFRVTRTPSSFCAVTTDPFLSTTISSLGSYGVSLFF